MKKKYFFKVEWLHSSGLCSDMLFYDEEDAVDFARNFKKDHGPDLEWIRITFNGYLNDWE